MKPPPSRILETKIPPLAVLAFVAGLMWLGARAVPAANFSLPARHGIALGFAAVGWGAAVAGVVSFRRAKTTVNPLNPAAVTALVETGIYRLSRNPMYLGMLFGLVGWAALLANALAAALVPTFVLYLNRFQIAPEETALASRFGTEFDAYCARVRRWL
jgi:protein-S-isoprenylcysteine O-methyltransferase Ste14